MASSEATASVHVRRVRLSGACVLVVALVAAIHAGGHANAATSPSSWDRRVAKYVRFVERHRSLEFDHPVPVMFLGDDAFLEAFRRDDPEITERDRVDAERSAGQLRALGLIEGPVDLIESQRDLDAADTVGFYDQERKALYVRGTDLTDVDVRITLVHELTHALQDQHFDLSKLDDEIETSGEDFALTALVEGDATSIEDDYLFSLPRAEQDAYFAEEPAPVDEPVADGSSSLPAVLDVFSSGPYIFGSRYVAFLREAGGPRRVDEAFATPPRTEEEIIDPVAALRGRPAARVTTPKLTGDERGHGDADDFGALSLYLVLASRLDPQLALQASQGWGGDRYVGFMRDDTAGEECVRIAFTGDTATDTAEIGGALEQWTAALPAGAATTTRSGDRVGLTACDTGGTTAPTESTLDDAVTLLLGRNDIALELLHAQASPRIARCAADHLATDPSFVALFQAEEFTAGQDAQFSDLITRAVAACQAR